LSHIKKHKTRLNGKYRNGSPNKITIDRQPFVYELWARGKTYRTIADLFSREYETVRHTTIFLFIKEHFEEAKAFREQFYANIKAIPIANAPVRIKELEDTRIKLKKIIEEMMDDAPQALNLSSLIRELRGLTEQIQDEAGDRIQKFKGDGFNSHRHFYLGDTVVNEITDRVLTETRSEVGMAGARFKENRVFNSENPLPTY